MKFIFTDIDGTLVYHEKQNTIIPDKTKECLIKLKEKGHKIIINTGRSPKSLEKIKELFEFDGYIASLGAYVEIDNKLVIDDPFDHSQVKQIIDLANKYNIRLMLDGYDKSYLSSDWIEDLARYRNPEDIKTWKPLSEYNPDIKIYKVLFKALKEDDYHLFFGNIRFLFNVVSGSKREYLTGEISKLENSKGLCIKKLIRLGIINDDTIAIGDGNNDNDMIKMAKLGIAMGNGLDLVKKQADIITSDVRDNGYYKAFKDLGLIDD